MIAIENPIRINRDPVFIFKLDRDFIFSTRPWLKNFEQTLIEKWCTNATPVVNCWYWCMYMCLTFDHQTLLEKFSADFDWKFSTGLWFYFFSRDHDRDQNPDPDHSDPDEKIFSRIRLSYRPTDNHQFPARYSWFYDVKIRPYPETVISTPGPPPATFHDLNPVPGIFALYNCPIHS